MTRTLVLVLCALVAASFGQDLHCVTHCQAPRCAPSCRAECLAPNCSYRCQNPNHEKFCGKPYCHTVCQNSSWGNCSADSCPMCEIKCSSYNNCYNDDCDPVCEAPQCSWAMKMPVFGVDCPLPVCDVRCETMPCSGRVIDAQSSGSALVMTIRLAVFASSLAAILAAY